MEIMNRNGIFHGLETEIVRARGPAAADPSTGHPDGEPVVIVIAAQ